MEALIEALLEIFGEILVEIIASCIGGVLEGVFFRYSFSPEAKRRAVRIIIYSLLSLMVLTLLILCFIYGKTIFSIATAIFILVNTLLVILRKAFLLHEKEGPGYAVTIVQIFVRIAYAVFIFVNVKTIQSNLGRVFLITGTILALIIYLIIDVFRYKNRYKKRTE